MRNAPNGLGSGRGYPKVFQNREKLPLHSTNTREFPVLDKGQYWQQGKIPGRVRMLYPPDKDKAKMDVAYHNPKSGGNYGSDMTLGVYHSRSSTVNKTPTAQAPRAEACMPPPTPSTVPVPASSGTGFASSYGFNYQASSMNPSQSPMSSTSGYGFSSQASSTNPLLSPTYRMSSTATVPPYQHNHYLTNGWVNGRMVQYCNGDWGMHKRGTRRGTCPYC